MLRRFGSHQVPACARQYQDIDKISARIELISVIRAVVLIAWQKSESDDPS
jgi:hypothetical protein